MEVIILGSGTCVPSLKRAPCSVLIRQDNKRVLIDAGPGIVRQLLKAGIHIDDIDVICISHFHPDHCADLVPFMFATKYPNFDRTKKLTLVGGNGIRSLFQALNNAYGRHLEMTEDCFEIIELDEKGSSRAYIKGLEFSWTKVVHKPESRAFRFVDPSGFSIVYSGDTDKSQALAELSENADVLICEAALPDDMKTEGHLTPSLAGEIAAAAGVKKLVLTHFYPECDDTDMEKQCRKTFKGTLVLARDLMPVR